MTPLSRKLLGANWSGKDTTLRPGEYVIDRACQLYRCEPNHLAWLQDNGIVTGYADLEQRWDAMDALGLTRLVVDGGKKVLMDQPYTPKQIKAVIDFAIESQCTSICDGEEGRLIWSLNA